MFIITTHFYVLNTYCNVKKYFTLCSPKKYKFQVDKNKSKTRTTSLVKSLEYSLFQRLKTVKSRRSSLYPHLLFPTNNWEREKRFSLFARNDKQRERERERDWIFVLLRNDLIRIWSSFPSFPPKLLTMLVLNFIKWFLRNQTSTFRVSGS